MAVKQRHIMKKSFLTISLIISLSNLSAQYQGPIPKITTGYGADGNNDVVVSTLINDHWANHEIAVFYPTNVSFPVPTIFYSHGYGSTDTLYCIETLRHIASRGYAAVFVPYKTFGVTMAERYATLFDGFTKASRNLTSIIDTTRVGFLGHSFGGGATPRISLREFSENNWGTNGKFIFCSAPWYSFELGDSLYSFPQDCKMITLLYDDDETNDHRMGMDIFKHIAIPDSLKDCILVRSDTVSGYIYQADHTLPVQYTGSGEFDALDYYAVFRLLDALADFTFTGNQIAKDIALGNGSPAQINMGTQLKQLSVTDNPIPAYTQSKYFFPCSSSTNERIQYCDDFPNKVNDNVKKGILNICPNPTKGIFTIEGKDIQSVEITNISGQIIKQFKIQNSKFKIDLSKQPKGIYIIKIKTNNLSIVKKIVIQ